MNSQSRIIILADTLTRNTRRWIFMAKTFFNLLRRGNFTEIRDRLFQKLKNYPLWYRRYSSLTDCDRQDIFRRMNIMPRRPLISVVMPVYNTPEDYLRRAILSVRTQIYGEWELCIADDASTLPSVRRVLEEFRLADPRIKVTYRERNGHISEATNSALELAMGEFVAFLDHDDELTEEALYLVAEEILSHPEAELIYSDQDHIDTRGKLYGPLFKPDWSPDLLRSMNYINHLTVFRTRSLKELGGVRKGFEGSQDYDLILRFTENLPASKIRHIPFVLYHWRAIPGSVALSGAEKNYAHERARKALEEHLARLGRKAEVLPGVVDYHRVRYVLPAERPLVSLIIGTRDKVELLRGICEGLIWKTTYRDFELIIMDNGSVEPETLTYLNELTRLDSRVRVIRHDKPFNFSEINNRGVRESRGSIVGLLNNDLEVIAPDWLEEMTSHVLRPEVGTVGARLLYGDGKLQHGGVITGIGKVAGHAHKFLPRTELGYMARAQVIGNFSAVTGACLLLRRSVWEEVGGLDEQNLAVAFNDVDLCLKVREKGYQIVYTPYAELFHLESASRGPDTTAATYPRFLQEQNFMLRKWGATLSHDPFYSPNLSDRSEDFALAFPPRARKPWIESLDSLPLLK